jgi:dipeptidase E
MDLLLLSNSRSPDGSYLVHALGEIAAIAAGRKRALFIPFAAVTDPWEAYTEKVRAVFTEAAVAIEAPHVPSESCDAVATAQMIVIGGGNTFRLLRECRRRGLLEPIAARVRDGVPFIGWSAGANLACPTICTTNDMPIVDPEGFSALGLVEFQINPHFTNALPAGHQGETRERRIAEYLHLNPEGPLSDCWKAIGYASPTTRPYSAVRMPRRYFEPVDRPPCWCPVKHWGPRLRIQLSLLPLGSDQRMARAE